MASDGNILIFLTNIKKHYPDFEIESMQCIDEGKNNVFSIEHRVFGKCVFKFLTPDRNIKRYITKVHPAIQELYHRYPEHPHIATI